MSEPNNNAADCGPCHVSSNSRQPGFLRRIFKKCAACGGSVAGGALAGHLGCIMMPVLAVTGMAAGLTTGLSLVFGAAVTVGGYYAWKYMRGQKASKFEKRVVIVSAVVGLTLSAAFNLFSGKHDHHHEPKDKQENVVDVDTAKKTLFLPTAPKPDLKDTCKIGCCGNK